MNPQSHARPGIRRLKPYQPGKPVEELERELGIEGSIKLASNENPLGASPRVADAVTRALAEVERYPDGGGVVLRRSIAAKLGVSDDTITLGNGSNDVLDLIARVFAGPGDEIVFSEHSFAVYPIATQAVGADAVVTSAVEYGHDLEAMADAVTAKTRIVFVANPNNPTGTWNAADDVKRLLQNVSAEVIVVIDEAYAEYVEDERYPDTLAWLKEFPNLVITRTFSKIYGLASLRIGYSVSSPAIADLINRVRHPFNVNSLAQAAALAALEDDEFVGASRRVNQQGMVQLEAGFRQLDLQWIPSVGNFITVDVGRDAGPVYDALLREGVIVRPVANYGLPNHLRVSIGRPEENERCLQALKNVLA